MNKGEDLFKVSKWLMFAGGTWRLKLNGVYKKYQKHFQGYSVVIQTAYFIGVLSMEAGEKLFRVAKIQMILTGTWQLDTELSEKWRILFKLYKKMVFFVCVYAAMAMGIKCFIAFLVQNDTDRGFQLLSYFICIAMSILKTHLCQTIKMTKLVHDGIKQSNMEASTDSSTARIYVKHTKLSNLLPLLLCCYSLASTTWFTIKTFYYVKKFRQEHEHGQQPVYLLSNWCPFNSTKYFGYCLTIEATEMPFLAFYNSVNQALFFTTITLCIAQMKVLQYNFQHFGCDGLVEGNTASQEQALANLKRCVRKHQNTISYIESINESWKYILLLEYVISSVMFAGALLQILKSNEQVYHISFLGLLVVQLTAICCIAEELRIQSIKIGDAIYESKWYEYNNKEIKQLMLIVMMRSRKPLSLSIGPFGPLTADVIVTRLRLAYSYMSLISGTEME